MGITLTDVLLFGKAQSDDVDNATLVIYRRNILRWGAIGGYVDVIVKGVSPLVLPDAIANSLSYVKAFGGTYQGNIPQQYTQVNYVTNTNDTSLDTGIVLNFAKNYELELRARATTGSWYIFQSRKTKKTGVTAQIDGITGSSTGDVISAGFNGVTVTSGIARTEGNIIYLKMTASNGTLTLYVRDETAGTEDTVTDTYTVDDTDALSSLRLWGNEAGQYVSINSDIYMAKVIENGVTVMDYVACRQAATAGFYDKVTGTFKTTTNLVADGNTVPTPDTPMDIVCNNGTIKVRRQSGLPLDYQKITFVRPDDSIDLGIKTTNNTQITTEFYREANITQFLYFSDSGSSLTTNTTAYTTSGNGNWRFGNRTVSITTPATTKTTYVQNKNGVSRTSPTEDSWNYSSVNSFTSTNNLKTGAASSGETEGNIRYYSILVEESGVAVLDLIPVRRLSDSKIGFYNLVNGDFFEATGNVVRGDDIADPVEIYVDGTVETIEDTIGNTATAEMLLKVGDYVDTQEILSGRVKRNVGIKILDGTENWIASTTYSGSCYTSVIGQTPIGQVICSHFQNVSSLSDYSRGKCYKEQTSLNLWYGDNRPTAIADLKQFLAAQYAAGTPVIVVYPLATTTTETVTGQTLQVQAGDNTLEITQASMSGLELEAKYKAGVSLTVQEVEDANLDPNVEVTIN